LLIELIETPLELGLKKRPHDAARNSDGFALCI
jgi:hypothetical protein